MKKFLVALFALAAGFSLMAADSFSSLEEQMTGQEFMATGLNKLSQQELDTLNEWIRSRSLATLDTPKAAAAIVTDAESDPVVPDGDRRGLASDESEDDSPIRSPIVGSFNGWDGQTVFKLENGMIWIQDDNDKFYVKDMDDAVAVIESGLFNTWRLHIEGHKSECKVKRIQ